MDEIIDFVGRMKNIKTHTISLVRGKVADESYKEIDNRKYLAAIGRLELNLKKKSSTTYRFRGARIKAAQDILQRRLIHRTTVHNRASIPCYAGRLNLVLTETGNVYPCELLEGPLGNVREADYDMENVINSQRARSIIRSIREEKCFCTHECYLMTNILFNPRMYPALAREYMQVRFKGLRTGD
jgi:radical SAM protein with 4Fe4S-binding SPASM domain